MTSPSLSPEECHPPIMPPPGSRNARDVFHRTKLAGSIVLAPLGSVESALSSRELHRRSMHVLANAINVSRKDTVPLIGQAKPPRRLASLANEWNVVVDDCGVRQAQCRSPVGAKGADSDSGWLGQQLTPHASFLRKFTGCGGPRCLTRLDRAAGWNPTARAMPYEQNVTKRRISDPDLRSERRHHLPAGALQPSPGSIELERRCAGIGNCCLHRDFVNHLEHPMPRICSKRHG